MSIDPTFSVSLTTKKIVEPSVWVEWTKRFYQLLTDSMILPPTKMRQSIVWKLQKRRKRSLSLLEFDWNTLADINESFINLRLRGLVKEWDRIGKESLFAIGGFFYDDYEVSVFDVFIDIEMMGDVVPSTFQTTAIELACAMFEKEAGIDGFMTCDRFAVPGLNSPYEYVLGSSQGDVIRHLQEKKTRGYYWGNFLNQEHVEVLGGEAALENAPVAIARRLEGGRYYLQLSDDINEIDIVRLRELKEFMKPILPSPGPYFRPLKEQPPFLL